MCPTQESVCTTTGFSFYKLHTSEGPLTPEPTPRDHVMLFCQSSFKSQVLWEPSTSCQPEYFYLVEPDYTINKNPSVIKSLGSQNTGLIARVKLLKFLLCCLVNILYKKEHMNLNVRFISHTPKSYSLTTINVILAKILVLLIKHPTKTYKLTGNCRQKTLTLSLEENLMHRGSSLMIFLTSFQVDVKVIFEKTSK